MSSHIGLIILFRWVHAGTQPATIDATFSCEIRENLIFPGTNERSKYFEVRIFRRMNSFAWRGTDHFSRSTEFLFSRLMHSDRIQRSLATNLTGFATLRKWQKRYLSRGRPTRYIGGYWVRRNVTSAADVTRDTSAAVECDLQFFRANPRI